MRFSAPKPSARLRNAAAAELPRLKREHQELVDRRAKTLQALQLIDDAIDEIQARTTALEQLAGPGDATATARTPDTAPPAATDGRELLTGPKIREQAVKVRLAHGDADAPLHYRDWLALLEQAGYAVAGQDPQATFLTQLSRSPVVEKAPGRGMYAIDLHAPVRLRAELAQVHEELAAVSTAAGASTVDGVPVAERRDALHKDATRLERLLAEAQAQLSSGPEISEPGAFVVR